MTSVNVTTTKNTVTVNGETRVVTVKTQGPQGPAFADGDIGDIVISGGGTVATIDNGVINNAKIASNAAIDLTKLATGALPTAITVTSANISDLSIVDADISGSAAISLSKLATGALPTGITISSANIPDLTIVNSDVSASAAIEGSKLQASSGSNSGTMSAADFTKLAGIETDATADQTASEIKTAYESNSDTNAFTDADHTKLDGIETAATADQTAAEIKTLLNSNGIVNAQIDASAAIAGTKISPNFGSQDITTAGRLNIEGSGGASNSVRFANAHDAVFLSFVGNDDNEDFNITYAGTGGAEIKLKSTGEVQLAKGSTTVLKTTSSGITITGNIVVSGTVDGVNVAANNTRLGTLLSSANGNLINGVTATTQSASDNSTKVATTAYTDTAVANLVDSAPGTLNTLNELAAALGDDPNFATTVTNSIATKLPLVGGTLTGNVIYNDNVKALFGSSSDLEIFHDGSNSIINDSGQGNIQVQHAGSTILGVTVAGINVTGNIILSGTVDSRDLAADGAKLDTIESNATADQTASEILTLIKTVDGAGSGLDADTLDSISSASFLRSDENDSFTGTLTGTSDSINPVILLGGAGPNFIRFDRNTGDQSDSIDLVYRTVPNTLAFERVSDSQIMFSVDADDQQAIFNGNVDCNSGLDVTGDLTVSGNMTVSGTTTTIDTTTLTVEDKNIELGKVSTPTDTTADQGGITLLGATNKTFQWLDATDSWTSSEHIALPDNKKLQVGDGRDFQIYFDGTHTRIVSNHTGTTSFQSGGGNFNFRKGTSESLLKLIPDGAVELYFDNSKKFETTSSGAKIDSGQLHIESASATTSDLDMLVVDGGSTGFSAGNDANTEYGIQFKGCSFNSGAGIQQRVGAQILMRKEGSWNATVGGGNRCDTTIAFTNSTGQFNNGTLAQVDRLLINSDGNVQIPNDNAKLQLGASQNLQIYQSATHSYIEDTKTGSNHHLNLVSNRFQVLNQAKTEHIAKFIENGAVELYYDGTKKLETTSTGVSITGAITGTADATINSITVGKGANSVSGNTVLGELALDASVSGANNTAVGTSALTANTTGGFNTAVGAYALDANTTGDRNNSFGYFSLTNNTTGNNNSAFGHAALTENTTGSNNVAIGFEALEKNTTGDYNVAVGRSALDANTTANNNTAVGYESLKTTTTASNNTAVGKYSLRLNTTGASNTALGTGSLENNTTAENNTAVGFESLKANTTGVSNTAVGSSALRSNTTGFTANTAMGAGALFSNTTGSENTAVGYTALRDGNRSSNTALGSQALRRGTTGNNNVAVGSNSLENNTANSNTAVGYQSLNANTTGTDNVAVGASALDANTTGFSNVAVGKSALGSNTTAHSNVAIGLTSLFTNTTGSRNTAVGRDCLKANTTGESNVAVGANALDSNTTGSNNTAIGRNALTAATTSSVNTVVGSAAGDAITEGDGNNIVGYGAGTTLTTGSNNVAVGKLALRYNQTGNSNVAIGNDAVNRMTGSNNIGIGVEAMFGNSTNPTGENNIAIGKEALHDVSTGDKNIGIGNYVLDKNTTGANNTAVGDNALENNTTGTQNTAVGANALDANTTSGNSTAIGYNSLTASTGSNNTAIGRHSGFLITTGANNVCIGNAAGTNVSPFGITTQSNRLVLGDSSITNAYIKVAFTVTSDERDKTDIQDITTGLDFVNKLKPKSFWFRKNRESDEKHGQQRYGFIAQDILALEGDNPIIIDNEQENHLKYKGEHLIPILVKAIQELTIEVNKLKLNG